MTHPETQNEAYPDQTAQPFPGKTPREVRKEYLTLFLSSGLIIALDIWTKDLVEQNLPLGKAWLPKSLSSLRPYARIIHLQNEGTAFGMFQDENQINLIIMMIAVVASGFIIWIFPKIEKKERALRAALILQLAGAIGNLISRIRYGHVLDFISVADFPVFNIADSSITVGLVVLIFGMFLQEYRERKQPPPEMDAST